MQFVGKQVNILTFKIHYRVKKVDIYLFNLDKIRNDQLKISIDNECTEFNDII